VEPTGESLIAACAAGDRGAFEKIYARHKTMMFNYFLCATGSRDLAEDLFQALFLRVFRAGSRYEPHQPFRVWLFSLARNLLRDRWRQLKRAPEWRSTTRHSPGFGERRCSAGSPSGRAPGSG
jgi:RNA polymerase sigma-70 factor (ECF subfamily)